MQSLVSDQGVRVRVRRGCGNPVPPLAHWQTTNMHVHWDYYTHATSARATTAIRRGEQAARGQLTDAHRGGALADGLLGVLDLEEVAVWREDGDGPVVPRHCNPSTAFPKHSKLRKCMHELMCKPNGTRSSELMSRPQLNGYSYSEHCATQWIATTRA